MRYREGTPPDPSRPYGDSMHSMLTLSAVLSIAIGLALFFLARRGKSVWLTWWSAGLVLCSILYLLADAMGLEIARI